MNPFFGKTFWLEMAWNSLPGSVFHFLAPLVAASEAGRRFLRRHRGGRVGTIPMPLGIHAAERDDAND